MMPIVGIIIALIVAGLVGAAVTDTFTDTISISYTGNGKAVSGKVGTYTGSEDAGVAVVIPAGAVNHEIDIAFPHTNIRSLVMAASQAVTVKTNSTSAPDDTISLAATAALVWGNDFASANPITADVTKLYVSNAGAVDSTFDVRVLYN